MKKVLFSKVLTAMVAVFLMTGLAQAQFITQITGTVTYGADNTPAANFNFLLGFDGDTTIVPMPAFLPFETDENGNFTVSVVMNQSYTITSVDSFSFNPFVTNVTVGMSAEEVNIHLDARTDLQEVTGSVTFDGSGVETEVYFVKLPNEINLDDFREYESHFNIPGMVLTRWASYHVTTDANGSFTANMLDGKYVVYIPPTETTLTHWGVFEVNGATALDPFVLKEMKSISGHIANADQYDFVTVLGYSLNAGRPFTAVPDTDGNYTMDVAPGEYVVRVVAFFDEHMYHVYYDSVYSAEEATHVAVEDDVTDINFTLPEASVSPFTVSGTITSKQSGLPLEGANVHFVSYNMYTNLYRTYEGTTDADGNYTVEGYTMLAEDSLVGFAWKDSTFFAQFYNGKATFLTADPILYHANENVTGIDFALDTLNTENAYAISGTVVDEDGNPVVTGNITAFTTATNVGVITAMIDTTGHYAFDPVFPAGSTVYLQAWGGYGYVPEIYNDAESWEDADAIMITDADQVIDFELAKTGPARTPLGSISGTVDFGTQNLSKASETSAYEGSVVYVRPQGTSEWTASDYVDENGNFSLPIDEDGTYDVKLTTRENGDQESTVTVTGLESDITMTPTGISPKGGETILRSAKLFNAYPNPFNPQTTIQVEMAKTGTASLTIYNVIGQKVKTLFNGNLQKGLRTFSWNGTDANNHMVASGLYFYQLKTGATVQTKAVMFLK